MKSWSALVQRWWPTACAAAVIVVAVVIVLGVLAGSGGLEDFVGTALRGVSRQRPDHSLIVGGAPLPVEARMLGIFMGFGSALVASWVWGRWRRSELPQGGLSGLLLGAFVLLGADGLNALFTGAGWPHAYEPRNDLRLGTGFLGGLALASFGAPVVNFRLWKDRDPTPHCATLAELLWSLFLGAGAAVVVAGGLLGPLLSGLAALLAVAVSFSFVNLYVWSLMGFPRDRVAGPRELGWPVLGAVGLTVLELAALAQLRGWAGMG